MDNSTKILTEIADSLNYLGDQYRYRYAVIYTMNHCKRRYNLRKLEVDVENVRFILEYFTRLDILGSWNVFEKSDYLYENKLYNNNKSKLVSEKMCYYRLITLCVLMNMFFRYFVDNNMINNEIKTLDENRTYKNVDALYGRVNHLIDRCTTLISEVQNDAFSSESDKITTIRCFEKMKDKFERCKRLYEVDMK